MIYIWNSVSDSISKSASECEICCDISTQILNASYTTQAFITVWLLQISEHKYNFQIKMGFVQIRWWL